MHQHLDNPLDKNKGPVHPRHLPKPWGGPRAKGRMHHHLDNPLDKNKGMVHPMHKPKPWGGPRAKSQT